MKSTGSASSYADVLKDLRLQANISVAEAAKITRMLVRRYKKVEAGDNHVQRPRFLRMRDELIRRININKLIEKKRRCMKPFRLQEFQAFFDRKADFERSEDWG